MLVGLLPLLSNTEARLLSLARWSLRHECGACAGHAELCARRKPTTFWCDFVQVQACVNARSVFNGQDRRRRSVNRRGAFCFSRVLVLMCLLAWLASQKPPNAQFLGCMFQRMPSKIYLSHPPSLLLFPVSLTWSWDAVLLLAPLSRKLADNENKVA